jgi:hypothetical protein
MVALGKAHSSSPYIAHCPRGELAEAEADSLAMLNPAVDRSRDRLEASETTRTFAKCYSNTVIKLGMTIVLACE